MLILIVVLFALSLAAAKVVRIVAWPNWRWNEGSWRARGLLSDTARGVVVRSGQFGTYLRDRGWATEDRDAVVFRDEAAARRVVAGLGLVTEKAPGIWTASAPCGYERVENGLRPGQYLRRSQEARRRVFEALAIREMRADGILPTPTECPRGRAVA